MQYSIIFTSAIAAFTTVNAAPIEQRAPQGVLGGLLGDGGSGGSGSGNSSNSHPGGLGSLLGGLTGRDAEVEKRAPQGVLGGLLGDGGSKPSSGNGQEAGHPGGVGSLLGGLTGRDAEVEKRTPQGVLGGLLGDGGSSPNNGEQGGHPGGVGSLLGGLTGRDAEVEKRSPQGVLGGLLGDGGSKPSAGNGQEQGGHPGGVGSLLGGLTGRDAVEKRTPQGVLGGLLGDGGSSSNDGQQGGHPGGVGSLLGGLTGRDAVEKRTPQGVLGGLLGDGGSSSNNGNGEQAGHPGGVGSLLGGLTGRDAEQWAQPAEHAYRIAKETLKKELSQDEFRSICDAPGQNSMRDVQSAVKAALTDYETKAKSSKARKWLSSSVFDTLAQHYPEFTSLAWGTFKFLFTAVLNHEELLTEISKAISRIGDMLPRTELHSELYPTERMREAVALLYAQIIEFALMAIRWFKKGKIMHSVAAIVHPFKLSFGPVIDEISELSRRVDELANAASKAEIRDQHAKIHSLERRMSQLMELMIAQQSRQNEILIDLRDQKQFFRSAQLEDVHQLMLDQGTPDSESSLAFCRSMRRRRVQKLATQLPTASIPTLKAWANEPTSSLLLAESRGIRTSALDFAVEFLNAVLERGCPIIWALPFLAESPQWSDQGVASVAGSIKPSRPSVIGILRSLVLQALQLSAAALTETNNPVTMRHLRGAVTIEHWFQLLDRCVSTLPALFVVVDISVLEAAIGGRRTADDDGEEDKEDEEEGDGSEEPYRVGDFVDRMSEMIARRGRHGSLKVVIAAVNFREAASMEADEVFGDMCISTDRGRQIGRLMRQPKYRGVFRQRNKRISEEIRRAVGRHGNRDGDDSS
ncbi:Nacht domain protein [Apiospora marii]|uniref:Nacht domain protein n=1 Tax=Apiospora marii TaxID=335849 RepID=A0ABR1RQP1_9PEZI